MFLANGPRPRPEPCGTPGLWATWPQISYYTAELEPVDTWCPQLDPKYLNYSCLSNKEAINRNIVTRGETASFVDSATSRFVEDATRKMPSYEKCWIPRAFELSINYKTNQANFICLAGFVFLWFVISWFHQNSQQDVTLHYVDGYLHYYVTFTYLLNCKWQYC